MRALAATLIAIEGAAPRVPCHERSRPADLRTLAGQVRIGVARKAAAMTAMRRAMMESQARSGHRIGLIVVSKSPTRPTSSPDSDRRRAISNATIPPHIADLLRRLPDGLLRE